MFSAQRPGGAREFSGRGRGGNPNFANIMYQVTFSNQAIGEINKMDKLRQIEIIDRLGSITPAELEAGKGDIGSFHRFGRNYYRLRAGDYRIYFELLPESQTIRAHYVLHQHTIADFVFRFKLPFSEETMVEQEDNFWKYLDSLKNGKDK